MLEDWQQDWPQAWPPGEGNEGKILQWAMDIQVRLQPLLSLPLLPDHREHVRQIQEAVNTLVALVTPPALVPGILRNETPKDPAPKESALSPLAEPAVPPHPLHILLVEDSPFTQKLITHLLLQHGHQVTLAQHGQEALAQIEAAYAHSHPFDIVLMDLRMPVMDGFETTRAIRQWEEQRRQAPQAGDIPRLPIIAVTALTSEADRLHAVQVGMDGIHRKPIQANALFAEMARLVPVTPAPASPGTTDEPPVTEEDTTTVTLDMGALLKTLENDWMLLGEIVELYRQDTPKQLQRIRDGIAHQDADLVREAAHSLKGASGAFGKTPAQTLAFQMEQAGRHRDLDQAKALLEPLQCAVAALEQALAAELCKNEPLK
ncbi:MAG: response regulator [Magnetococcales bacterium]|nr:response regulator [Magnetococcales bacterium]